MAAEFLLFCTSEAGYCKAMIGTRADSCNGGEGTMVGEIDIPTPLIITQGELREYASKCNRF